MIIPKMINKCVRIHGVNQGDESKRATMSVAEQYSVNYAFGTRATREMHD